MPYEPTIDTELERILNIIGLAVFPTCLCLGLPVFIYALVMEKETKLVETMKINGMKMKLYWSINFTFFFAIYLITATLYYLTGAYIFDLSFFYQTNLTLMIIVFVGWGLCQISLAFLLSVFLNSSQTASIIGYCVSIWSVTVATTMNSTIYTPPRLMDAYLLLFPPFPFCRAMYYMAMDCAYSRCF